MVPKVFLEKKQQHRAKQAVAVANKQFKYLCTFLSLKYITLSFFKLCFFSFSRFQYFLRKKKVSPGSFASYLLLFSPLLFLLPRIQLPLNMVLLYCFLSFFSWEEMLTQKWQRMKSKMMLLIHLLLFLPCRSRHLSFWKKLYVIGPLGLSSIEMKNCNEKLLPIYVLTWKNKDRLAVYVVVHFLLHKKWTLHCF